MIYFVETPSSEKRSALCRWVERLHEEGRKIQIVVDSTQAAQHLDQLLWTFSETSFIPHRRMDPQSMDPYIENVVITVGEERLEGFDVLVCDSPVPVSFMKNYTFCVHFVPRDDEDGKQESRLLWQEARDQGMSLHHVPYTAPGRR